MTWLCRKMAVLQTRWKKIVRARSSAPNNFKNSLRIAAIAVNYVCKEKKTQRRKELNERMMKISEYFETKKKQVKHQIYKKHF